MYTIDMFVDATVFRGLCGYDKMSEGATPSDALAIAQRMKDEDGANDVTLRINVCKDGDLLYNEDGTVVQVIIAL